MTYDREIGVEPAVVVVEKSLDELERELGIPKQLRTEFNFVKFPFFDLAKNPKREDIKVSEVVTTKDGSFEILWHVSRNVKSQFPGEFEKNLHRAVERIINTLPKPIPDFIKLGSLRDIAREMGLSGGGENTNRIIPALKSIVGATIEAKGTFKLKEGRSKKYINDVFHLYDRVIFQGEQLPDGKTADAVYVVLGSWYRNNVNNNYVIPLDWYFYRSLNGSITTRMYEYLGIQFFVAQERGEQYVDLEYEKICKYFPVTQQTEVWLARKQLKDAHTSLTEAGYLERVEWLKDKGMKNLTIRYWIGPKARTEYESNKEQLHDLNDLDHPSLGLARTRRRQLPAASENNDSRNAQNLPLERELVQDWGVTPSTAQKLLKSHPEARIREVIAWAGWAKAYKPTLIGKNPAGWIRKALEENWAKPPAGFVSEAEKQAQRETIFKREAEKEAAKEREWQEWLQMTPEERVRPLLELWITKEEKIVRRLLPQDEILLKERELISREPTPEEKQIRIFGYVKHQEKV